MRYFHILLADDHENIRFTFQLALEADGYAVDTAATLAEARARMARRCYHALILYLGLGTESGLRLLADLRADGMTTPVLMMTAHGTTDDAVAAMKLGAADFLTKPIDPVRFRSAVAELLRRHLPPADNAPATPREECEHQISRARHALNCRDAAAARSCLNRALELNSHSADAHYLYGCMLELINDPDKAKRYYSRALQLYVEHSFAYAPPPAAGAAH